MNQPKIGEFISYCRKEKNITQAQLAEKLNITDRAVSKWETGKSVPDPSIMLELCDILGINVNELLTGERLSMEKYKESAEGNLLEQQKREVQRMRDTRIMELILGIIVFVATIVHFTINYNYPDNTGTGMGFVIGFSALVMLSWFFFRNYEIKPK